jgi:hypothetical protein
LSFFSSCLLFVISSLIFFASAFLLALAIVRACGSGFSFFLFFLVSRPV